MAKIDDRVTELEIELADLRALKIEVADLRAQLASRPAPVTPTAPPKPKAVVEEGATVSYLATHSPAFVMPDENQLQQLLEIACRRFPVLRAGISSGRFHDQDERNFFDEYASAFRAIGAIARMPAGEVDQKHYADRTVRMVQGHLRDRSQFAGFIASRGRHHCSRRRAIHAEPGSHDVVSVWSARRRYGHHGQRQMEGCDLVKHRAVVVAAAAAASHVANAGLGRRAFGKLRTCAVFEITG
jgi:hypothetical protein